MIACAAADRYAENTKQPCASGQGGWINASTVKRQLLNVFRMNRHGEGERFAEFEKLGNRKLLWHGIDALAYLVDTAA